MTAVLALLWTVRTARTLLRQTSLWQTKEYRADRMAAHVRLPSTVAHLSRPGLTFRWGLLVLFLAVPEISRNVISVGALTLLYAGEGAWFLWELHTKAFRRPRPTAKALGILTLAASMLGAVALWGWRASFPAATLFLILDRVTPLVVACATLAVTPVTRVQRARTIHAASGRIREHQALLTVGITGSYGKSSTKEFLATILEQRFQVLKTPANVNTEIGIAQTVLTSLKDDHNVFVCEMGAYRVREIARAASIVRPRIGILTAIGEQHLALFGSTQRLAQAKGELLDALPPEGTAIVNGDDPLCLTRLVQTPAQRRIRFGLGAENEVRADSLFIERTELRFQLHLWGATRSVRAPLLGAQQIPSILAAAAGAHALGFSPDDVAAGIARLRPLPRTMEPRSGPHGAFVIDDTYSANPAGVLAALAYLRAVPAQKRVVVMTTMIELGRAAANAHALVGETLAALQPALVILTARDYAADITRGALSSAGAAPPIVVETSPVRARARVEPFLTPETAVLLEGRIPDTLRSALVTP